MDRLWRWVEAVPAGQFFVAMLVIFAAMYLAAEAFDRRARQRPQRRLR